MFMVDLLNFLIHFMSILTRGYLFIILSWSPCENALLFYKSLHDDDV
jgi:hypothetical protein